MPAAPTARRTGRGARALARAAAMLAGTAVFAGGLFAGVVLHLDTAPARRITRDRVNVVLATLFEGKIVVDAIDRITLGGVEIERASAIDPRGERTIQAFGIRARADVLALLANLAFGRGDVRITIPVVRIEHAEVVVGMGPARKLTIEETFTPKKSKQPPKPPTAPRAPARPVRVSLERIEVGHAWVHGAVAPPRALDADVSRLVAALVVGPEGLALDVEQTGLVDRTFLPAPTAGTANYHLRASPLRMWTSFAGEVGAVEVQARATLEEGHLTATGDVPAASPAELATLLPGIVLAEPVTVHVELDGDIPRFDVKARAAAHSSSDRRGTLELEGRLDASGPVRLELDVAARDLDPRVVVRELPATRLEADGRVLVELGGAPRLSAEVRTQAMFVDDELVPPAELHLVLDRGSLSGTALVHEAGAPIEGVFALRPKEGVVFAASSDIPSLRAAPRLAGPVDGRVRVAVAGSLRDGALSARVDGAVAGLRAPGGVTLGHGSVRGEVAGPLSALELEATLTGSKMNAGGREFARVFARASGPLASPALRAKLEDERSGLLDATGRLDAKAAAVRGISVRLERDGEVVEGTVARVQTRRGTVAVEGIALRGEALGQLEGSLDLSGQDVTGTLRGTDVDLERVGRLTGMVHRFRGLANVDVSLERAAKGGRSGHVRIELENGEAASLSGISAQLAATFRGDEVEADGFVRLVAHASAREASGGGDGGPVCDGEIAKIGLTNGSGKLRGPLLSPATWRALTGSVEVALENWNLHCLSRIAPPGLPISDVDGTVAARFAVSREPGERFPSLKGLALRTRGLAVAGKRGLLDDEPAWELAGIDVSLAGGFDAASGTARAEVTLWDQELLADAHAEVVLDIDTLWDDPRRRWDSLRRSPLAGRLSLRRRSMDSLRTLPPAMSRHLPPVSGEVGFDMYASGSLDRPTLFARAAAWDLMHVVLPESGAGGPPGPSPLSVPIDLDASLLYDAGSTSIDGHVRREGNEIATASGRLEADLPTLLGARSGPWTGSFEAKLVDAPIGDIPALEDHDIGGHVSGTVAMTGLNRSPRLSLELTAPDLVLGPEQRPWRGSVSVRPHVGAVQIAEVKLRGQRDSALDVTAFASTEWRGGLLPAIDRSQTADVSIVAKAFSLSALSPFVAGTLSKLDGQLDGEVRFGWKRLAEEDDGTVRAHLRLTDGVVHVPQIGQELRGAHAVIVADGGLVRIEDFGAAGITGHVRGSAQAKLDGLAFARADGSLVIAESDKVPLTIEGVPLGMAWGDLRFGASKRDNQVDVDLDVKKLRVELPASTGRDVQPLDELGDVHVSHPLGPPQQKRSAEALRWVVALKLEDVRVEGELLAVELRSASEAPPRVEIGGETRTSGDVQLAGGRVKVLGKRFEIERGLIRLNPDDTSNPYLNVTAHWDARDGSRIYVDYAGDLSPPFTDKLKFRSGEHSQEEIFAALLFDEDLGGEPGQARGAAVGAELGNQIAASQFNQLLSGVVPGGGLSTRLGTTEEGAIKTSLAYELGESVTAAASYEGSRSLTEGEAQAGTAPGGAASQKAGRTEVSIDWRFHKNWLLRGKVGVGNEQPSSGLDLLWQYRY